MHIWWICAMHSNTSWKFRNHPTMFNKQNCIEQKEPSYLYSLLTWLMVACSACFAWTEFNAHWLRELGGSFLLVENTPNLLLLLVRLLGAKMGEKSTPGDPPELCQIRLVYMFHGVWMSPKTARLVQLARRMSSGSACFGWPLSGCNLWLLCWSNWLQKCQN